MTNETKKEDDTDDGTDFAKIEEEHGREYIKDMQDPYGGTPELDAYLGETDTSLENDDLGQDEDGNREDD